MFYSQFILAKKGPLGTIWIAAHLERKLRKNQVADTDIGVSVDSILFPEVPIALRLSSHLLLGVVRIYSRKVNYLFHDCSEALLKIKQAFRSTAVDLPPEESTAPYHSITLPETFHLDDFELPDSALQGDFVDHHVSTKEQITLQDTVDGTGFQTSQFGLDERFGDGNTSQIGLDLDEDLFLDQHQSRLASNLLGSNEGAMHQGQSSVSLVEMDVDHDQSKVDRNKGNEASKESCGLSRDCDKDIISNTGDLERNDGSSDWPGYNIQTPDLNEVFSGNDHIGGPSANQLGVANIADEVPTQNLIECAQAPSTPGLIEEMISANEHESPALSPQGKASPSVNEEAVKPDNSTSPSLPFESVDGMDDNSLVNAVAMTPELVNIAERGSSPLSVLTESKAALGISDESHLGGEQKGVNNQQPDDFGSNEEKDQPVTDPIHDNGEAILSEVVPSDGLVSSSCPLDSSNLGTPLEKSVAATEVVVAISPEDGVSVENVPGLSLEEVRDPSATPLSEKALHVGDSSFEIPGDVSCVANATDTDLVAQQKSGDEISDSVPGANKANELSSSPLPKENHLDQLNCSSSSEFPEPEKMLLAPNGYTEQANELGQLTTEKGVTESDGSVNRIGNLSGKKRRLMESTPVLQNGSSVKLSGKPRIRRNIDYIPDDDDLLASILVGKRTSALRMGPTPPPKIASLKRPRLTGRSGVTKRKVLLDDTVVLHADAIRQQLINTEDIRRVRKKAPCTRPEIWMIQKSSLEEEIFNELIITGVSAELNGLHTRRYDLETNACHSHANPPKEVEPSRSLGNEISERGTVEPTLIMPDKMDGVTEGPSGTSASIDALSGKEAGKSLSQDQSGSHIDLPQLHDDQQPCAISPAEANVQDRLECNITTDCIAEGAIVHGSENTEALSEMSDGMCLHSGQQSVHEIIRPAHELSEMDDGTLNSVANASSKDLPSVENDTCGRVNDQTALGAVNDHTLICAGNVCIATDASIMEGNRSEVDAVHLNCSENVHADGKSGNGETSVSALDHSLAGVEAGLPTDSSTVIGDEFIDQHVLNIGESPNFETIFVEGLEKASVSALHPINEIEMVPSAVGENSGLQELNVEGGMDVESAPMDIAANKECSDFCSAIDGNDTEFLNVDDEADYDEAAYNDVPNPEEAQSLENSGWSSRTRGVARYLKTLFDEESGRGRRIVAMDHLLAGKTRKEASRMFFETLVLKTRDYIEVGQEKSFDCINIKPRINLLKSEF